MCLLTLDPGPKRSSSQPTSSRKRRESSPAKPTPMVNLPLSGQPTYPIPVEYRDFAGAWIAGQAHAEAQAEKAKKTNPPPPSCPCKKPSGCCDGKRRCSSASSVSVRSFQQVKKRLGELYRRQEKDEAIKEREKWDMLREVAERERFERARDRRSFERLESKVDTDRERSRTDAYINNRLRSHWGH